MNTSFSAEAQRIMAERFGPDCFIGLATLDSGMPAVRTVNGYYEDGCFYVITYALSGKMRQIAANPAVAVCGDWFTGRGIGENLGHILLPENRHLADQLRGAFAAWYHNGHINEADPNTCILRIRLTEGVLLDHGTRYEIKVM